MTFSLPFMACVSLILMAEPDKLGWKIGWHLGLYRSNEVLDATAAIGALAKRAVDFARGYDRQRV
ncbi:MAG: hypothetical protein AAFP68_13060 [Pseudomonadota bacterium]